jgi:hypothetical protein
MSYATIDDVQRRMPQFALGATTRPNLDTAQTFLDDTIAQFEAALENLGYVIPLTGARSLAQAKEIISQGTICKILGARASAVGTDVAMQSADRACKQYEHALELLADPNSPFELTDADRTPDMVEKPGAVGPSGRGGDPRIYMDSKF